MSRSSCALAALVAMTVACGGPSNPAAPSASPVSAPASAGFGTLSIDTARCFQFTGDAACLAGPRIGIAAASAAATAPSAPQNLTGSATGSSVALTWTAPASGDPVTTYVIEAGSAPGLANLANFATGSTATSFSASGVGAGTYYVRVRAQNGGGVGPASNEFTLVVGAAACIGPTKRQITETRGFAVGADGLMEEKRVGNRGTCRGRMRADFLEFPDIAAKAVQLRVQRPQSADALTTDVQKTRSVRRHQPLVQARAVDITLEFPEAEREVRSRLRPIDDGQDATLAREAAQIADRKKLSGGVRDVREVKHSRSRRDGPLESCDEVVTGSRHRKLNARDLDLVAPGALVPRPEHQRVVLIGRHHFVVRPEIEAALRGLQRLGGVARHRHLFSIASELFGELPPHPLEVLFDEPPVIDGELIREIQISFEGFLDAAWGGGAVSAVQIDEGSIDRERLLDFPPVRFVLRSLVWRPIRDGCGGRDNGLESERPRRERGRSERAG